MFWGRLPVDAATAFLFFKKGGMVQTLVHKLKYQNAPFIGYELGKLLGFDLRENDDYFKIPDLIMPVPLHWKKEKRRGYNQSTHFARGIAEVLEKPIDTSNLYRKIHTSTQTKKSRYNRWENVSEVFGLKKTDLIAAKHVLLVDDVITTGATLEACGQILLQQTDVTISIATLAVAD